MTDLTRYMQYARLHVYYWREAMHWRWRPAGRATPHLVKRRVVRDYAKRFGSRILVETGTLFGDMLAAVARHFDEHFVDRSYAKPHVDLAAFTIGVLHARGFDPSRIFDSRLCTRCDGSIFHSFRRDGSGGRNLAFVAQ